MMKKFNPSVLALSISSLLLTSTLTFGQIQQQDKALFGVKEHQESLLFHQSLVEQGSDNVPIWRIPSLLRTKDGVLIAAADKRWQHRGDWGDIDTAIRISHDDGKTWGNITTILDLPSQNGEKSPIRDDAPTFNPWGIRSSNNAENKKYRNSAFLIDAQMVQDQRNGRLFLAVDMYPESTGLSGVNDNGIKELGSGYVNISGKNYLKLYPYGQANGNHWTLRENGEVFDENNKKTEYRVEVNGEAKLNFRNLGNVYKNGEYLGNIYLKKEDNNKNVPFVAPNTAYIWLTYSDDNGKTWVNPIDITSQVKKDWMRFFGTGPGVGIQTKNGNLVLPVYYSNLSGMESAALIISQDGGKSWELGKSPNDTRLNGYDSRTSPSNTNRLTEAQLVELDNGDIKLFMRNQSGKVMMSTSKDGGYTWVSTEKINELNHGYSQLSVIKYSKKINGKEYIVFSGQSESGQSGDALRRNGKLFLGEVQEDGSIQDRKTQVAVGLGLDYDLSDLFNLPNTNISLEMKKGRRGFNSDITLTRTFMLTDKFSISPSFGLSYYSAKYTNYYFGIKKAELNKTKLKSVYHPKKAYSGHIALNSHYAITDHIGMGLSFSWETYSKAIKKSPIVKRSGEISSALNFYYMF